MGQVQGTLTVANNVSTPVDWFYLPKNDAGYVLAFFGTWNSVNLTPVFSPTDPASGANWISLKKPTDLTAWTLTDNETVWVPGGGWYSATTDNSGDGSTSVAMKNS